MSRLEHVGVLEMSKMSAPELTETRAYAEARLAHAERAHHVPEQQHWQRTLMAVEYYERRYVDDPNVSVRVTTGTPSRVTVDGERLDPQETRKQISSRPKSAPATATATEPLSVAERVAAARRDLYPELPGDARQRARMLRQTIEGANAA